MIREIIVVAVMLAIAAAGSWLCAGASVPEAYVFPKTVITVMVIMALIQFIESIVTAKKIRAIQGQRTGVFPWKNVSISLCCMFLYFISMESIGFYSSGFLFFLITTLLLDKKNITLKNIAKRVASAVVFMTVLFVLFHVILAVQTPKGLMM